jgi:hypothetical protein
MARTVYPDCGVRLELDRKLLPLDTVEPVPELVPIPTLQMLGIVPADECVIGDVEILGP